MRDKNGSSARFKRVIWVLGYLLILQGVVWLGLKWTRRNKGKARSVDQILKPNAALLQQSWQDRLNQSVPALPIDIHFHFSK